MDGGSGFERDQTRDLVVLERGEHRLQLRRHHHQPAHRLGFSLAMRKSGVRFRGWGSGAEKRSTEPP